MSWQDFKIAVATAGVMSILLGAALGPVLGLGVLGATLAIIGLVAWAAS